MNPRVTAILPCSDIATTRAFFEKLDFSQVRSFDNYSILQNAEGAEIHLRTVEKGWLIPERNPFGIYVYAENVDDLATRFTGKLLGKQTKPESKPWGMYEFALSDPDGTLIRVGWSVKS